MKKSNSVCITLAVSTLIMLSAGCRSLGKYADDVGRAAIKNGDNIIARNADDVGRATIKNGDNIIAINADETADIAIGFRQQPSNKVANQFTDEAIDLIKKRVKSCGKKVAKNVLKESIDTRISSGYTQISVNLLLNESKRAIGNCVEIEVGRAVHDTFLMESASSTVAEVANKYQGQIEFTD